MTIANQDKTQTFVLLSEVALHERPSPLSRRHNAYKLNFQQLMTFAGHSDVQLLAITDGYR